MTDGERLAGKRILIVEDEYYVADDLRRALLEIGVHVVGPVQTLATGLELARSERLDGALLDINLDGVMSLPIADVLIERGIPFGLATGYDHWSVPERYRGIARLTKPYTLSEAIRLLAQSAVLPGAVDRTQGEPT